MSITESWPLSWTFTLSWWSSLTSNFTQVSALNILQSRATSQPIKATNSKRLLLKIKTMMKNIKSMKNLLINMNKTNTYSSTAFTSSLVLKSPDTPSNTLFWQTEEQFHWLKTMPILLTLSLTDKTSFSKRPRSMFNLNGFMTPSISSISLTLKTIGSER